MKQRKYDIQRLKFPLTGGRAFTEEGQIVTHVKDGATQGAVDMRTGRIVASSRFPATVADVMSSQGWQFWKKGAYPNSTPYEVPPNDPPTFPGQKYPFLRWKFSGALIQNEQFVWNDGDGCHVLLILPSGEREYGLLIELTPESYNTGGLWFAQTRDDIEAQGRTYIAGFTEDSTLQGVAYFNAACFVAKDFGLSFRLIADPTSEGYAKSYQPPYPLSDNYEEYPLFPYIIADSHPYGLTQSFALQWWPDPQEGEEETWVPSISNPYSTCGITYEYWPDTSELPILTMMNAPLTVQSAGKHLSLEFTWGESSVLLECFLGNIESSFATIDESTSLIIQSRTVWHTSIPTHDEPIGWYRVVSTSDVYWIKKGALGMVEVTEEEFTAYITEKREIELDPPVREEYTILSECFGGRIKEQWDWLWDGQSPPLSLGTAQHETTATMEIRFESRAQSPEESDDGWYAIPERALSAYFNWIEQTYAIKEGEA